jgi:hypothetical protein
VRGLRLVLPLALAVGACAPLTAEADAAPAPCGPRASWVAGSTAVCGGVLEYGDYLFDAFGADTQPSMPSPSSPYGNGGLGQAPAGDLAEPAGLEGVADLVRFRVRVTGDVLELEAELNAVYAFAPEAARVVVALDTDGNPGTGGGAWGTADVRSAGWDEVHVLDQVDASKNTASARLRVPRAARWRLQAVTALADGTPLNVAFRDDAETGAFWDENQAAMLASGDVSPSGVTVDTAELRAGRTRASVTPTGRRLQRVYTSRYTAGKGEGVDPAGVPTPAFKPLQPPGTQARITMVGRYLPYSFSLPAGPGPHGLQLVQHGIFQNIDSQTTPGALDRLSRQVGRVLVGPTGRGPTSWYAGLSQRDVLDAVADVLANYPVDEDRVVAGGYSMGGYGTLSLVTDYPDLFAGFVDWVGYVSCTEPAPVECVVGGQLFDPAQRVGNLRHVPGGLLYSAADELVHVSQALGLQSALARSDVPHTFWLHAAEHLTFLALDDWRKESTLSATWPARVRNPARVTYRTDRRFFFPQWDLVPDGAYWVDGMQPVRDGWADVDATTSGCGTPVPVIADGTPEVGTDPVPWTSTSRVVTGVRRVAARPHLDLRTAGLAAVAVDARRACLTRSFTYSATTDVPLVLTLSDGRSVRLPAGTSSGTVAARAAAPATDAHPAPAGPALPATGLPGWSLPAAVVLLLVAGALVRRRAVSGSSRGPG